MTGKEKWYHLKFNEKNKFIISITSISTISKIYIRVYYDKFINVEGKVIIAKDSMEIRRDSITKISDHIVDTIINDPSKSQLLLNIYLNG